MSWLRTDDGFVHHPKFEGWPAGRRWAWLEVMHYCARYSTQGRIPNDLSLLPKSATEKLLTQAEISGWIDRDSGGDRWIHDWQTYNPKDPTKAERQAKWRANKAKAVDNDVDAEETEETSTESSTSRARLPSRPHSSSSKAAASTTPANPTQNREAAAALINLLDDLKIKGGLRLAAMQDPERALACALKATSSAKGNPAGYFRRLLESGDTPTAAADKREYRPYGPTKDPVAAIRIKIRNGAIPDLITLNAELTAANLNGTTADQLRALLPTSRDPDDDIPV